MKIKQTLLKIADYLTFKPWFEYQCEYTGKLKKQFNFRIVFNLVYTIFLTMLWIIFVSYFRSNPNVINEITNLGGIATLTIIGFWSFIFITLILKIVNSNLGNRIYNIFFIAIMLSANLFLFRILFGLILFGAILGVLNLVEELLK